jgi:2-polyprenyl-6-methoxyphenol hydroxylase-like FAD-dependent oxidoreductase
MTQQLPVLVAGGGIGGLAAALALVRQGFDVKVLEQAAEPLARLARASSWAPMHSTPLTPWAWATRHAKPRGLHRLHGDARRAG